MSRLTSIFLIALFLNIGAGDELYAGGLRPRRTPLTRSLATFDTLRSPRVHRGAGTPSPRSAYAAHFAAVVRAALTRFPPADLPTHSLDNNSQTPVGATDAERGAWLARRMEDRDTGR